MGIGWPQRPSKSELRVLNRSALPSVRGASGGSSGCKIVLKGARDGWGPYTRWQAGGQPADPFRKNLLGKETGRQIRTGPKKVKEV